MKFHKHVTREIRELLQEQLKEYEANTRMTKEERKELHNWVASGRSPYDNGDYLCGDGGYPLDFISALRANKELQEWYDSLSEDEKQAKKSDHCYQYSTDTDEIYFDTATFKLPDSEGEELPFQ